ncbi:MAG: hypothetical protein HKM04_09245 [Legionellales bacterium]|nr:hypothetical protein [Legionellales bacterium]
MKKETRHTAIVKPDNALPETPQETTFLLSEPSFQLLRHAQQRIREKTDMIPSIRKMINVLITPESIEKVTQDMIELYRD